MVLYRGIWRCIAVYGDVLGCMMISVGVYSIIIITYNKI